MSWRHFARLVRKNALSFPLVPPICGLGATLIAYYQFVSPDKTPNSYYGYEQSNTASLAAHAPYAFMEKGGMLDGYIAQRVLGMLDLENAEIVGETNERVEYGFAIRKTKSDLFRIFASGSSALQESGEFDKNQARWVEERFLISKSACNTILTSIMIGAGISLAVLVLFFLWTSLLHEEIGLRTAELSSEIDVRKRTEAQLLANQAQLIQADKLAAIGTLASGIAHEINYPGLLSLNISFLKRLSGDLMQTLEAVGVSARTLSGGFRRFRDMTPRDFLREQRLLGVREALARADPRDTVTTVAGRWGYVNFGIFAAICRRRFGERPSDTLTAAVPRSR